MKKLDKIGFKRCLVPPETPEAPVLCVFSDASQEAFGACAYVRQKTKQSTYEVNFVAAKSRVAPLKQLTIPRLELQAAVASRLAKTIVKECTIQFADLFHDCFREAGGENGCLQFQAWNCELL